MPIKLPFGWWLCRDTTTPVSYPPRCREMLVRYRLELVDKDIVIAALKAKIRKSDA